MSVDSTVVAVEPSTKKTKKKENLKQRAYLNSLSSILDYGGAQITGFIINPFIVGGLGNAMYGVWQILGQLTGYTKMADTRASQALKWSLASKRDVAQEEEFKHFGMDLEFLLRKNKEWREILQGILFTTGDIVKKGDKAEEEA